MWIIKAPGRVDFTGGYTDVPPFTNEYVGSSVNMSITLYTWVLLRKIRGKKIRVTSKDLVRNFEVESIDQFRFDGNLDIAKAAISYFNVDGIEIISTSEFPAASGMGSSGAYGVALVGGLNQLTNSNLTAVEVAEIAAIIERKSGSLGGLQDQLAASLGGCHMFSFYKEKTEIIPIHLTKSFEFEFLRHGLLINTGGTRSSSNLVSTVNEKYISGDSIVISALQALNQLAYLLKSAIESNKIDEFGYLISSVRENQKKLSKEITSERIEKIFDIAYKNGAIAGKGLGGAGGAGCLFFWCDPKKKLIISKSLQQLGCSILPLGIDQHGLKIFKKNDVLIPSRFII